MKKRTAMIGCSFALAGCVAMFGCGSPSAEEPQPVAENASVESESSEATKAEEAASAFEVTIDDATVGADYEGAKAVIVTYTWKNNSDQATSAAAALHCKCFQNGVQLENAIVTADIDSDGFLAEVKPGAGTTFQVAYLLDDESDVTIEVTELISLDDKILVESSFSVA